MTQKTTNMQKIVFKDYYKGLTRKLRSELKTKLVPKYMGYPTFYNKIRDNSFTALEFEKLEELTKQTFIR